MIPGTDAVDLHSIMDIIQALAFSVATLQLQEKHGGMEPVGGMRVASPYKRQPMQSGIAGPAPRSRAPSTSQFTSPTGTIPQVSENTRTISQAHPHTTNHTTSKDTLDRITEATPDLSLYGFTAIFALLDSRQGTYVFSLL